MFGLLWDTRFSGTESKHSEGSNVDASLNCVVMSFAEILSLEYPDGPSTSVDRQINLNCDYANGKIRNLLQLFFSLFSTD